MRRHYRNSILKLVALAIVCGLGGFLAEQYALRATMTEDRLNTAEEIGKLRSGLESLLNADVQLVRGLVSYVKARPDLGQEEFSRVAADLLDATGNRVRNLALARDLVVSHVYPVEENRAAIGLDYRETPTQWPQVERAIRENVVVIAGPLALVQGGIGLVARFPVYIYPEGWVPAKLWGIVSTVIDFNTFVQDANLPFYQEDFRLALVGRDGLGRNGEVFWGEPDVLQQDPVLMDVHLVSGTWAIAAAPRAGWPTRSGLLWVNIAGTLVAFAIGAFILFTNLRHDLDAAHSTALLKRARREAEAARETAQQANKAKSEFLAAMSHELRTPLNAILGFSDILYNQYFGPPGSGKYREYAGDIHSSAMHLLDLVNDVLDISAIEAGKTALNIETIDVGELIEECVHTVRERAGTQNVALETQAPTSLPKLNADRRAVKQVLLNLLSNAVKFTPGGGTVCVCASSSDGMMEIEVVDTGVGIAADRLPHITTPFTGHARNPYTSERGWGLGLSISKALIDLHGGDVDIQSEVGRGTTVIVRLRLDQPNEGDGHGVEGGLTG